MKQLAVLGSPIGQALAPVLHRAAYQARGAQAKPFLPAVTYPTRIRHRQTPGQ